MTTPPGSRNPLVARARRFARPLKRAAQAVAERVDERREPTLGWLRGGMRAQPSPPEMWDDMWEGRRRLIKELAPGRSFLDLGGMYGIHGELSFIAEAAGATRVTLFDGMDPSPEFIAQHERDGSRIEFVQGDAHDAELLTTLGPFDVVWCTGVIYHSPNPMQQLRILRSITTEQLVLGTHVIPEVPGLEQMCMLYPGVTPATQDVFARALGGSERFPGMATPFDDAPLMVYANMWWGFSPSALRSMMHHSGFEITEERRHGAFFMDVVAKLGGVSMDIYPPDDQSRERVRRRHEGTPDADLPVWAAGQVRSIRGT